MSDTDPLVIADIPGWPGYRVSTDGRVWTSKLKANGGWRSLLAKPANNGYPRVSLSHRNIRRDFHVHEIVLLAFVGPRPTPRHVCRHLDGDPTNNGLANLAWGTFKENEKDKAAHGRRPLGERVYGSKLSPARVIEIRRRYARGDLVHLIAADVGVSRSSVEKAIHGQTWRHVPSIDATNRPRNDAGALPGEDHFNAKLREVEVIAIRQARRSGRSFDSLAAAHGVSVSCIKHIVNRSTWRHIP